jgi:cardiolipin synthase
MQEVTTFTPPLALLPNVERWASETLYLESQDYFNAIELKIKNAHSSIDHEVYIFRNDSRGAAIAKLLVEASTRGVTIRLLVDAAGSLADLSFLKATFKDTGVELRFYNTFWSSNFFGFLRTYNRRNHRKVWIFDSTDCFVSSANSEITTWKETGLQIAGAQIQKLQLAFDKLWFKSFLGLSLMLKNRFRKTRFFDPFKLVLLNDSVLRRIQYFSNLKKSLSLAKEKILIANAYFIPPYSITRQIEMAARRGVEVILLVTQKSDVFFMPWVTQTLYGRLIRAGVKIFEYEPCFYHAKIRIIDNEHHIGSFNLNHRSLLHDLEVDIKVTHSNNQQLLESSFRQDLLRSKPITQKNFNELNPFKKLFGSAMLYIRYWL